MVLAARGWHPDRPIAYGRIVLRADIGLSCDEGLLHTPIGHEPTIPVERFKFGAGNDFI